MEPRMLRVSGASGAKRLSRAALFASTALSAVLGAPAFAQTIGANTTPTGGVVVAGSATITQTTGNTTIDQSSNRAAINWQTYNVGSSAEVDVNQPGANSIELNRVVGGDLSQINGKIISNGQIVLINQSGVVFAKGSQVNAENIVVSTSNISDKDFMAGHLNFTGAPNPGAQIINEGHLTAKQAGLVGLVAPQVNNSGVITAKLGQVILAGATAFTLDLYGDRLISLDVTQAVRAVDLGGKTVPALVTNSGIIIADGGHVTLTAQDADALVTQLINAGGTIQADTVGGHTGTISLQGVGGDIAIAGNLLTRGTAPGSTGGAVEAVATGTVAVASNAVIDASGAAGGGVVALGTNLARARAGQTDTAAPKATAVIVASGAQIHADATAKGKGGTVTLLSKKLTDFAGAISVQGGPQGGNGGLAEISSDGVISLGGTVLATAIDGEPGEILLDPDVLNVVAVSTSADTGTVSGGNTTFGSTAAGSTASNVLTTQLDLLTGRVILEAHSLISVSSAVDMNAASALSLVSLGDISITAAITVAGSLEIDASNSLSIDGRLSAKNVALNSGTAGTSIDAVVTAGTLVALTSGGTISEGSAVVGANTLTGDIHAPTLTSGGTTIGGSALLTNTNTIANLGGFTVASGQMFALNDSGSLNIAGSVVAPMATISAGTIGVSGDLSVANFLALESLNGISETGTIAAGTLSSGGTSVGGNVGLTGTNTIATLGDFTVATGHSFVLDDTGSLDVAGPFTASVATLSAGPMTITGEVSVANQLALESSGTISEGAGGELAATTLTSGGTTIGGNALLTNGSLNTIGTLGGFTVAAGHTLALDDTGTLTVAGPVVAPVATLSADSIAITGSISSATLLALESSSDITELTGSGISAGTLTSGGTTIGGSLLLTGTNTIATLGSAVADGDISLDDTGSLGVTGSVGAADISLAAGTLGLAGNVTAAGTLALAGGNIIQTAGSLGAGTLIAAGDNILLDDTANSIATLGSVSVSTGHTLSLVDSGLLTVSGPVTAPTASLTSDTIALAGDIDAPTRLALGSSGSITQTSGSIATATLAGIGTVGGDVSLTSAGNSISNIGGFTLNGTLDLQDSTGLTVVGAVRTPGEIEFTGTSLGETGTGALSAATLTSGGDFSGDVSLVGANSIATIVNLSAAGNFYLSDRVPLDIVEHLYAGENVSVSAPTIGIDGYITAGSTTTPGTLALAADTFNVGGFTINGATIGGELFAPDGTIAIAPYTNGRNIDIGSLAAGDLDIMPSLISIFDPYDPVHVVIGEAVGSQATNITIDNSTSFGSSVLDLAPSGTIRDNGTLFADVLAFSGSGFNQATTGELVATELEGAGPSITGSVALISTLNEIGELGSISVTGDLTLVDSDYLLFANGPATAKDITLEDNDMQIDGSLTSGEGGTINLLADTLYVGATLSAPGGTVAIAPYTDGYQVDFGGEVPYGTLSLNESLGTLVNADVLQIGTAAGHYGGALTLDGSLTIGPATLALSGTSITFNGSLAEPGLVTFNSPGDVSESAGAVIAAGTVAGAGGTIALLGANSVANLGTLASLTDLGFGNTESLTIAGTVSAPDTVTLEDTAGIGESTGIISAGIFTTGGTAIGGDLALGNTNSIATLGGVSVAAGHSFDLNDGEVLTVNGPVVAPDTTLVAQGITVAGSIVAANTLALGGTGLVTEVTGGIIDTGSLISLGTLGGDVRLANANSITTLGGFTVAAGHTFDLNDTGLLTIAGPVVAPTATFSAGTIAVAGSIDAATLLAFESPGNVTQTGGVITTGNLTTGGTSIGGSLRLGGANAIASLGGVTVANTLAVNDAGSLTVAGPVVAPVTTLAAGSIGITGSIDAATLLALESAGDISETGGKITTGTLTSGGTTIGGAVSLLDANTIGALGNFAAADLALNDSGNLLIDGLVQTPGTLTLEDTGNIDEVAGGTIFAGTLSSGGTTIGGNVSLQNANSISTIGDFALGGDFILNSLPDLTIAGLLSTPGTVTLDPLDITESTGSIASGVFNGTASGNILLTNPNSIVTIGTVLAGGDIVINNAIDLAIAGTVSAPGTLTLEDAGSVTQTAGTIFAGTLNSGGTSIGGDVNLGGANSIASVGGFTIAAGHSLALNDVGLLTLDGPIVVPAATFSAGSIGIAGSVDTTGLLAFKSSGDVTETSGDITAGTLTSGGTEIGGNVSLNNANSIGTLGGFNVAGGLTLADDTPLTIAAPVSLGGTLALLDTGDITQTGGSIIAAALTSDGGTIGGAVSLQQPGNQIPVLGDFAAIGGLALADTGPLSLAGNIFTGTDALSLFTDGAITQTGGSITTGTLNADGSEISLPNANSITRLGNVSTDDLFANGVATITGSVNANNATVASPGNLTLSGPVTVANSLVLNAVGNLTQAAGTGPVTAGNATFTAAAMDLSGTTDIAGELDLLSPNGNIIHNAGILDAGTLTGRAGSLASFAATTDIGTLASFFMQDSLFVLDNSGPLTFIGPLLASTVSIAAVGLLTLEGSGDGGLFVTGSIAPTTTKTPRPGDSLLTVSAGPDGSRPEVVQNGTFFINAGPNASAYLGSKSPEATVFISTSSSGNITFAQAPPDTDGVDGPTVDLELASGSGGVITGNIDLRRVVILSAGRVNLTGTLDNVTGPAGAGNGFVNPFPQSNFQFNACPIGSVNCTILPIESLPSADPLQNFEIDERKKRRLNHNVQLPGIATRDF